MLLEGPLLKLSAYLRSLPYPDSEGQIAPIRAVSFLNNHPTRRVTESWGGILANGEPPELAVVPVTTFSESLASSESFLEVLWEEHVLSWNIELPMVPAKKGYLLGWSRSRERVSCGAERLLTTLGQLMTGAVPCFQSKHR